jgi:trigger factor
VNLEIKEISPTRKSLVVTLDAAEVDAEHQAVVGEFSRMARLPGFRPGKAPAAMVAKRFGKEIAEEFKQKVVAKAYREGSAQAKLDVVQVTNAEEGVIAPGVAATITITVDLRPEFKLPDLAGFTTEVLPAEPTEAEVDATIEALRAEKADFKVAARAAAKGDYVKLAYEGRVEGKPIMEIAPDQQIYGRVPQTWEEVEGPNEGVIPGLGKQIGGLAAGEKRDVTITFPADFAAVPALAGQVATYAVEVQEVRERTLPPLDEAFLQAHQADTLDLLKTNVRNQLKLRRAQENHRAQRSQVLRQLSERAGEFPVPDSLVEEETQGVLRNFIEQQMRRGVPAEQFEKDKKEIYEGARQRAVAQVRNRFLLTQVATQEKLTVTEEEMSRFLYRESVAAGMRPEKLARDLAKDRGRGQAAQLSILFDKALDLLVSRTTVKEVAPKPPA